MASPVPALSDLRPRLQPHRQRPGGVGGVAVGGGHGDPAPGPQPSRQRRTASGSITILRSTTGLLLTASLLLLSACERQPSPEAQRIEELNLKIQQLEQRLNTLARERSDGADRKGKPPAGVIKSLTIRTGTEDDRLRIYWADGSTTDLPCTKEQATFACG